MKRTVITYGTFDLFHVGHLELLRRARNLGDELVVYVSTDEFNVQKGKASIYPCKHRSAVVQGCRYVDHVFRETNWDQKPDDIELMAKDGHVILVMGDDWVGKFDHLTSRKCTVVYLPRTPGVSTSEAKAIARRHA